MRESEKVEWVSTYSGDAAYLIQARWNDYDYDYAILVPLYNLSLLIIRPYTSLKTTSSANIPINTQREINIPKYTATVDTMVQAASASKNIWVAASDGDLDRVRVSISLSNNIITLIAIGDMNLIKTGS